MERDEIAQQKIIEVNEMCKLSLRVFEGTISVGHVFKPQPYEIA